LLVVVVAVVVLTLNMVEATGLAAAAVLADTALLLGYPLLLVQHIQ
jgi:hypothetical protein